jgi:DNA repair protein RadA/Sms
LGENIIFVTATLVEEVTALIESIQPRMVIIDSIQTVTSGLLTGAAGSIGQIRETADQLTQVAKAYGIPLFLVGHVTKDGVIAGPKVLEHIVDAVLELSGERSGQLRLLRAIKNRFGATDEVGVFMHSDYGLEEVANPSAYFLEHADAPVPGSATVCVMEGTRPLLAEVQALVVSSQLAMPRRVGRGIELARIQVLAAVLQKHCKLPLGLSDVFLSAAGGYTIKEPAVDLGLAVALASSLKNKALPKGTVFIGEVGLLGEIRQVSYLDQRIKEAKRLGYSTIISRKTHRQVSAVLKEFALG